MDLHIENGDKHMIADIGRLFMVWLAWGISYLGSFDYVDFVNSADKLITVLFGLAGLIYTLMKIIEMATGTQIFPGSDNGE